MGVGYATVAGCHEYGMDADVGETYLAESDSSASGGVGRCGEYSAFYRMSSRLLPVS